MFASVARTNEIVYHELGFTFMIHDLLSDGVTCCL